MGFPRRTGVCNSERYNTVIVFFFFFFGKERRRILRKERDDLRIEVYVREQNYGIA